jgi:hypothetical protein
MPMLKTVPWIVLALAICPVSSSHGRDADRPTGIPGGGHVPHFGSDNAENCTHRTRNRIKALMTVEVPPQHDIHPSAKNRLCDSGVRGF